MTVDVRLHAVSTAAEALHPTDLLSTGLSVRPFRGIRYSKPALSTARIGLEVGGEAPHRETADALKAGEPHSVLHVSWPQDAQLVPHLVQDWLERGVLIRDEEPSLYVYEYCVNGQRVRGLLADLSMDSFALDAVICHEATSESVVDAFRERFEGSQIDVEPVLIIQPHRAEFCALLAEIVEAPPLQKIEQDARESHTLWRVDDPKLITAITNSVASSYGLIADGHHRFASHHNLSGLLVLVTDSCHHAPELKAIHRVLPNTSLTEVRCRLLGSGMELVMHDLTCSPALISALLEGLPQHHAVVGDGERWLVVGPWADDVDVVALHEKLLPSIGVRDEQLLYRHSLPVAIDSAVEMGGVATLLKDPLFDDVLNTALQGQILPEKATSFGPKPSVAFAWRTFS